MSKQSHKRLKYVVYVAQCYCNFFVKEILIPMCLGEEKEVEKAYGRSRTNLEFLAG